MTKFYSTAALAAILSVAATMASAGGSDQLARHVAAGPDDASSLDRLAALKFNRDSVPSEFQRVVSSRTGSSGADLDTWAAGHFGSNPASEYAQGYIGPRSEPVTVSGRHAQLLASARLVARPELTLDEIAAAKFASEDDEAR